MKKEILNLSKSMNRLILIILIFICIANNCTNAQVRQIKQIKPTESFSAEDENAGIKEVKVLQSVYTSQIIGFENNFILFADSSRLLFDDGKQKTDEELIENPDVQDMFVYSYPKGKVEAPTKFNNPGRIRNEEFFKKMYGRTSMQVQQNLTTVAWCPKLVGQKLKVTKINGVVQQLESVSAELDKHPEWKDYLYSTGTFNWRTVRGTNRLSPHSFGIAIDLNTQYSNYWQWDCKCTSENTELIYKNQIPQGIVDIFEKHGFIWGGKWYHYDTMHFEYRPELLF